jgi:hypothetical protein
VFIADVKDWMVIDGWYQHGKTLPFIFFAICLLFCIYTLRLHEYRMVLGEMRALEGM